MDDNNDDLAKETPYGLSIPASVPAEKVLFGFLNELRHLVASLEGYATILSKAGADSHYTNGLLGNIERVRYLSESARVYLMETNYLSKEREVMHFLRELVFDPIMNSPEASNELKEMIVKTVRELHAEAARQMVDSWIHMTSKPTESDVIRKMKEEGFTQFETTLPEFRTRFVQN